MNKQKLCLSSMEISELTGLSLSMVRKLTHSGEIPHIKVGRRILYPTYAIDNWLRQNTITTISTTKGGDVIEP